MVEVWLPYGNTEVCLRVPTRNLLETIEPKEGEAVEDSSVEVQKAILNPISSERLSSLAKPGKTISIVVKNFDESDMELNKMILANIINELTEAGVKKDDINIIVAYDPLSPLRSSLATLSNSDFFGKMKIIQHNPQHGDHVEIGKTSFGTKLILNRTFVESDIKITVGFVEPHIYAGYSGCKDAIIPGISNVITIRKNQILAFHPKARSGVIYGNPVHEDMVEAESLAGVDFSVNVVRNCKRKVYKVFAGDPQKSFISGVRTLDGLCKAKVGQKADIVFSSPGGHPYDDDLRKSIARVIDALEFLKKNGVLVLVAECSRGYGDEEFFFIAKNFKNPDFLIKKLKKKFTFSGYLLYRFLQAKKDAKISMVTILPDYYIVNIFNIKTYRTVNEALRYAFGEMGRNAKLTIIPRASFTVPSISEKNS